MFQHCSCLVATGPPRRLFAAARFPRETTCVLEHTQDVGLAVTEARITSKAGVVIAIEQL